MGERERLLLQTRRHFFGQCGVSLGSMALLALEKDRLRAAPSPVVNPLAARPPHFAAKAKSVIYLFMAGGPSQLELFDYKPKLMELDAQPVPESFIKGKRFAFMDTFAKEHPKCLGGRRKFARHGNAGTYVSECLPHIAGIADDIAVVRSVRSRCALRTTWNGVPATMKSQSSRSGPSS